MKYSIVVLLGIICFGCSGIRTVREEGALDSENQTVQFLLKKFKAEDSNTNILFFTSGFENESVKIISGRDTIFQEDLNTIPQLSLAQSKTVKNEKDLNIEFYGRKKTGVHIFGNELKKYKFVYVAKIDNKIQITL